MTKTTIKKNTKSIARQQDNNKSLYAIAGARITLGLIYFWAFLDKLIGLGFSTCRDKTSNLVSYGCKGSWLNGGSPTSGFLENATKGPFAQLFQNLSGNILIDGLFMMGLMLIGLALITGIGVRVAVTTGSLLMFMMWASALPPSTNPLLDEHIVYILVLLTIGFANKYQKWGLGRWWSGTSLVRRYPFLQ